METPSPVSPLGGPSRREAAPSERDDGQRQRGQASVSWTIGTVAGNENQQAQAAVAGFAGSPVTYTASAVADTASKITIVSGNNQSAPAATALQSSLVVRLDDTYDNPVSGVTVSWSAQSGGGSPNPATAVTGAAGTAATTFTLARRRACRRLPLPSLPDGFPSRLLSDGYAECRDSGDNHARERLSVASRS